MRKELKDSRRLAQKIPGEKSVQMEATACAEVLWQGVRPPVPGTPRVPTWLEKISQQEYRVGAEQG